MPSALAAARGNRESPWLVLRRSLAIIRRLMRGPATKDELLAVVRDDVGPDAYSESASAAERALKNDRAAFKQHLAVRHYETRHLRVVLALRSGLKAAD